MQRFCEYLQVPSSYIFWEKYRSTGISVSFGFQQVKFYSRLQLSIDYSIIVFVDRCLILKLRGYGSDGFV